VRTFTAQPVPQRVADARQDVSRSPWPPVCWFSKPTPPIAVCGGQRFKAKPGLQGRGQSPLWPEAGSSPGYKGVEILQPVSPLPHRLSRFPRDRDTKVT
jgi:hypothetical protein